MPLKLNVGVSKKQGLPDYGSVGASCHVEIELEGSLLQSDLELFHRQVRNAYVACRQAVSDELACHQQSGDSPAGNGHQQQDGHTVGQRSNGRRATASQVRAIHAITNRQRINLVQLLNQRFQVGRPEDLSISEASQLIDSLKGEPAGNGGGR